jgi:hypothetical protein
VIGCGHMIVAHADWSGATTGAWRKRWLAWAEGGPGSWRVHAPRQVRDPVAAVGDLKARAGTGAVLLGVDFPIGLPIAYARTALARFPDFRTFLCRHEAELPDFHLPCATLDEVRPDRPFFPLRSVRGEWKARFLERLQLDPDSLLRRCDRRGPTVAAACGVFWTLGPNQVGKAALAGWRELLLPFLQPGSDAAIWPFDGSLPELLACRRLVFAETYPAEAYGRLGFTMDGRKGDGACRRRQADPMRRWALLHGAGLDDELAAMIDAGFDMAGGDDPFDAVAGLLGMLPVAAGQHPAGAPDCSEVRTWEGWMLGRLDDPG